MPSGSYEFDQFSESGDELRRLEVQASTVAALEAEILRGVGIGSCRRIIEIGAGPGFVTKLLAANAPDSAILAIDYSEKLLEQCKMRVAEAGLERVLPTRALGEALPLSDGWGDFAYARFLLQHVPDALEVIAESYRCLGARGMFCAVDSDDALLLHYPEQPVISDLLHDADLAQRKEGGDRKIGRKLQTLLYEAGFRNIQSRILTFTTTQMPLELLMGMGLGYKAKLLGREAEVRQSTLRLKPFATDGSFFFAVGVVLVTGQKGD